MNTNNLQPFDLETALKHPERVVTRDGIKVTQLTKFDADNYQLAGVFEMELNTWDSNGKFNTSNNNQNKYDLFLIYKIKENWVNVYILKSNGEFAVTVHDSKKDADTYWQKITEEGQKIYTYIKTIRITNEPE